MPIGARDILLVVRAKDEASRVLRGVGSAFNNVDSMARQAAARSIAAGSALVTIGAGMAGIGIAALNFFNEAKNAAVEYNKQAALTQTQTLGTGIKLSELKDIGRRVASEIPAPFETLQGGLYDIFSSIDVNKAEAEVLLKQFAKDAVAGQVDVRTAVRANIEILNAYGLGAADASKVSDIMFQMVAKGVGTYDEFTTSIGKSIPSARRSGQELETVAGIMAFLTKQGLSTSMASTAAARAFDLIANSKVSDKLHKAGIEVYDANGNFRQMNDIVRDLHTSLAGLTSEERTKKLGELFKGGGNSVQAQRFFNAALNNFDQFDQAVTNMHGSAGVAEEAYKIMFDQPAMQADLLSNRWKVLKTEIGDMLIPAFEKMIAVGLKVVQWFQNLDPHVKELIVKGAALAAVILTIVGVVLTVVGAFLIIQGTMALLGVTFGGIIVTVGLVILVLAALVAAGILIYKNWDTIKRWAKIVWEAVSEYAVKAWNKIKEIANKVAEVILAVWDHVVAFLKDLWHQFGDEILGIFKGIGQFFQAVWADLVNWWHNNDIAEHMRESFRKIAEAFQTLCDRLQSLWDTILYPVFKTIFETVKIIWIEGIWPAIRVAMEGILKVIKTVIDIVVVLWKAWGDKILSQLTAVWNLIVTIITGVIDIIVGIISFFIDLVTGHWSKLWDDVKMILGGAWDIISGIFTTIGITIGNLVTGIVETIVGVPGKILNFIGDVLWTLWQIGVDLMTGLFKGITHQLWVILLWAMGLGKQILGWIGDLAKLLWDTGVAIMEGLYKGALSVKDKILNFFGGIAQGIADNFKKVLGIGSPSRVFFSFGENVVKGFRLGIEKVLPTLDGIIPDIAPPGPANIDPRVATKQAALAAGRPSRSGMAGVNADGSITVQVYGPVSVEKWNPTSLAEELAWQIRLVN